MTGWPGHEPTDSFGGTAQWSRSVSRAHVLTAGTDFGWVDGDSIEDAFDPITGATKTLHRVAGGTQRSVGVFLQDGFVPVTNVTVTARLDSWRNYDARHCHSFLHSRLSERQSAAAAS